VLPAVKVDRLWKEYVVGQSHDRHATFYDTLSNALKAPFRKRDETLADSTKFWALNDVSFEVQPGEVVGIIGRNGAGKSTLLKVLSRITAPTKGRVEVRGRLASLLEVGTGFHGELSGRENIFLNGAILGMSRKDIAKKFDEIVAFAEVEKFIDTPVKRYSSGMYVRLAFAVAAHLDSDVLIIDEVLAVGDSAFREKCLGKMGDVSRGGKTVLFVSHDQSAVSRLCSRAIVLSSGEKKYDASAVEALAFYSRLNASLSAHAASVSGALAKTVRFERVEVNGGSAAAVDSLSPANAVEIDVFGHSDRALEEFRLTYCLRKDGALVLGLHDAEAPGDQLAGPFQSRVSVPALMLTPGHYVVDVNAYSNRTGEWVEARSIAEFHINTEWHTLYEPNHGMGMFNLPRAGSRVSL
jgi:lipopolysaccharide transport system ATP-binding protein